MTAAALRLVGSALLTLAGAMLGAQRLSEQRGRLACLRSLCAALGHLAAELEALESPLGELFARRTDCPFFRALSDGFGTQPLAQLWQSAAETQPLSATERAALAGLGAVLGRANAARQVSEIALARRALAESAGALEREIAARARRFPLLGAALGAIAAAVLF